MRVSICCSDFGFVVCRMLICCFVDSFRIISFHSNTHLPTGPRASLGLLIAARNTLKGVIGFGSAAKRRGCLQQRAKKPNYDNKQTKKTKNKVGHN